MRVEFGEREQAAVARVLASGRIVQGPEVEAFEREFSDLVGGRECAATNSGTSALHLALLAAGIGLGDEVIVPSFSFAATANAVAMTGARPVFADIDPATFCIDPESVRAALTDRTKAVIAVHLFGHLANMPALRGLTQETGLLLMEDAAQAHLGSLDGIPAGAWGDVAAFSFYATKNLTTGEGGMVVTDRPDLARTTRLLRNQGMEKPYHNEIAGLNNRMTDMAAAIGRVRLKDVPSGNDRRRRIAELYDAGMPAGVVPPSVAPGVVHAFHQYTVRSTARDALVGELNARGIEARVFYPTPIHLLPAYRHDDVDLPHTQRAAEEVLSLPIYPNLDDEECEYVIAQVREVVGELP